MSKWLQEKINAISENTTAIDLEEAGIIKDTKEKVDSLKKEYILWEISKYILENNIPLESITFNWSEIFISWEKYDTKLNSIDKNAIESWLKDYYKNKIFLANDAKVLSQEFSWEFVSNLDKFNDTEEFRKFLIEKRPEYEVAIKLLSKDELSWLWIVIQSRLIEANTPWVTKVQSNLEKALKKLEFKWSNGKSIFENWEDMNPLVKAWAWIAAIWGVWKIVSTAWKKFGFEWKWWEIMLWWFVWEFVTQLYTWKSLLWDYTLWPTLKFVFGWSSNKEEIQKLAKDFETQAWKSNDTDFSSFPILILWEEKDNDEIKWDFSSLDEKSDKPFFQMFIAAARKEWAKTDAEAASIVREKLKTWRNDLVKKVNSLIGIDWFLSIDDLTQIEWAKTFWEKLLAASQRIKTINENITNLGIRDLKPEDIYKDSKNDLKRFIKTGIPTEINLDSYESGKKLILN
jgi:hypothetical protein